MIEKTKVCGFLHYRTDLGDGVRTGVVFSFCREACNRFCLPYQFLSDHAFTLDTPEKDRYTEEEMIHYLLEEKTLCYTKKLGISFLGAEPLSDPFFCKSVAKALKEKEMNIQIHTCGMCSFSSYDLVAPYVDMFVLRLFPDSYSENFGNESDRGRSVLSLFESRGYPYRVLISFVPEFSEEKAEEIAILLKEMKFLKSVILDFSFSNFSEEKILAYKKHFLKHAIPLY